MTLTQTFSCEYCENFENTYFEQHLQTAATTTVNQCSWMSLKQGIYDEIFLSRPWNFYFEKEV